MMMKSIQPAVKNLYRSRISQMNFHQGIRWFSSSDEKLEKTAFYDMHLDLGGKMVPFAGYELPVQYEGLGVKTEHEWTRAAGKASLFDVSHMGQIRWYGNDAVKFIEKVVCGDIEMLKSGEGKLSLIMNENSKPIFPPKLTWIEMNQISSDAIILVLSSDEYNIKESLREKNKFLEFISNSK